MKSTGFIGSIFDSNARVLLRLLKRRINLSSHVIKYWQFANSAHERWSASLGGIVYLSTEYLRIKNRVFISFRGRIPLLIRTPKRDSETIRRGGIPSSNSHLDRNCGDCRHRVCQGLPQTNISCGYKRSNASK